MRLFNKFILLVILFFLCSSCVTKKKLTYLQYSESNTQKGLPIRDSRQTVTPADYKIMPYDNLFIRVITPDPQYSDLFNIMPSGGGGAITSESASLLGYPVDTDGFIEIPFVGKVEVAGKTLSQIKIELDSTFKNYVTDAAINVRMVNNYVSIIGEVAVPGRYPITKDQINVFEALAMAGDMTEFSNRQKVQIIRVTKYGPVVKEFNLKDRSILTSEYFYVMPNDIIYAQPMRGKTFQMNSAIYSMLLTTITTLLTIFVFFRPTG